MAIPKEGYPFIKVDHESMVLGGVERSVKFLALCCWQLANDPVPLVPTFMGSHRTSAHLPKRYSWTMGQLLDYVSMVSKIRLHSMIIESKLEAKFPTLQWILCSELFERAKSST